MSTRYLETLFESGLLMNSPWHAVTNAFDSSILHFLNAFAGHSRILDSLVIILSDADILKGGVVLALFWWAWARKEADQQGREILIFAFVPVTLSLLIARGLALSLPFRIRPLNNPALHLTPIHLADPEFWVRWSSFPSDHAALFFCLATALWITSRRLGIIAVCYTFFAICIPRIYLGAHYPTDIVAGACVGTGCGLLCNLAKLRKNVTRPAFRLLEKRPGYFYAAAFLSHF